MYSELKLLYYRTMLIQTRRGNKNGRIINAKPILLITVFDNIGSGKITNNKIYFDYELMNDYEKCYTIFEPEKKITPIHKPFFHLQSDGYWHLFWSNNVENKVYSAKLLREDIKYASFDNALWDLLQDFEARNILKEALITFYITRNNK